MSPRDRRALRLGTLALLGGVLLFRIVPTSWRAWREAEQRLEVQEELLARAQATIREMSDLDSVAASVRQRFIALAPRLIDGRTAAEVHASLEGLTTGVADRARLRVRRAEATADSAEAGKLRRAGLALELEGDWAGLTMFLRSLAAERVALTLGEITVTAADPTSPANAPEVLVIQAELSGWYLPKEAR